MAVSLSLPDHWSIDRSERRQGRPVRCCLCQSIRRPTSHALPANSPVEPPPTLDLHEAYAETPNSASDMLRRSGTNTASSSATAVITSTATTTAGIATVGHTGTC